MAYVSEQKDSEDVVDNTPPTFSAGAPQTNSGSGIAASSGPTSTQGSGMFTDLGKFIKANQGESEKFAGKVATGAENKINEAVSTVGKEASLYASGAPKAQQAVEITADTFNPNQEEAINQVLSQPSTLKGFSLSDDATNKASYASNLAMNLGTEEGVGVALQDWYKSGNVGARAGERDFDRMLLGRDINAKNKLSSVASTGQESVKKALEDAGTSTAQAKSAYETAAATNVAKQKALLKVVSDKLFTQAQERLAAKNAERAQTVSSLGGTVEVAPGVSIDRANYITNKGPATLSDVMTNEQAVQLNALDRIRMVGGQGSTYSSSSSEGPSFDQGAFEAAVDEARSNATVKEMAERQPNAEKAWTDLAAESKSKYDAYSPYAERWPEIVTSGMGMFGPTAMIKEGYVIGRGRDNKTFLQRPDGSKEYY
jgi:hypothetical protein